jgi:hypothetical protein
MPLKKELKKFQLALKEVESSNPTNWFGRLFKKFKIANLNMLILKTKSKLQDLKIQKQYNK